MAMNLWEEATAWEDSEAYAQAIKDRFTKNLTPCLREHRDFCKQGYGYGEDAFHWLWKLLVDEMPQTFSFLEVGVFKGQILSLVRLLSKQAEILGITLLSPFAGVTGKFGPHPDDDYRQSILDLHTRFGQPMPKLIVGDSTDAVVQAQARARKPFDIVFVDGCHEYDFVCGDLMFYPTLLKPGGFLVVDDAACDLKQPWGFFQGIADVCKAVRTVILVDPQWEHVLTVCHDRVWRRV